MDDKEALKTLTADIMKEVSILGFVKEDQLNETEDRILEKMKEWEFQNRKIDAAADDKMKVAQLSADWVKALANFDQVGIKQMEEKFPQMFQKQVLSSGATQLVPSYFINQLIEKVEEEAQHRRYCTVIPVPSSGGSVPNEDTGIIAYWVDEGVAATQSDPTFGQTTFSTSELATRSYWSEKLFEVSAIALTDFIARLNARAIAKEEAKVLITGSGTKKWKGLDNYTIQELDGAVNNWDFFVKTYFAIKGTDRASAVWTANDLAFTTLFSSKDSTGRPFFTLESERLLNKPILSNENVGEGFCYYGNLRAYYIFDQRNYNLRVSREGDTLVTKRLVLFSASVDSDGRLTRPAALRKITNILTIP